jgi:hypothetical protein
MTWYLIKQDIELHWVVLTEHSNTLPYLTGPRLSLPQLATLNFVVFVYLLGCFFAL